MMTNVDLPREEYTKKQGQYLAYIHLYTKINGISPAHADIQHYFKVSPPSVNQMLKTLTEKSLISRVPKTPRSLTVLIPIDQLPCLQ